MVDYSRYVSPKYYLFYPVIDHMVSYRVFPVPSLEPTIQAWCWPWLVLWSKIWGRTSRVTITTHKSYMCLHNRLWAFVVTGPACALCGLITNLRKVGAPTGLDQSKNVFSQRKLVFSVTVRSMVQVSWPSPSHREKLLDVMLHKFIWWAAVQSPFQYVCIECDDWEVHNQI